MKKTSKVEIAESGAVMFDLPLIPIPAPRPRVRVHNGVGFAYYAGKYKTFLVEAPKAIPESPIYFEKGVAVDVAIDMRLPRPKKPTHSYPVGDIDNYQKSILDAITKNGTYWHDDSQVAHIEVFKRYANDDEEPGYSVGIKELSE